MIEIEAINAKHGMVLLSDGSVLPVLEYYDHSGSCEAVDPEDATQMVAGNDTYGYWCVVVAEFKTVEIH